MRLSTSVSMMGKSEDIPVEQAVQRLASAGYGVLDFPFCNLVFDQSPLLVDGWDCWLREVRQLADSLGVEFSQGHGPWGIVRDWGDREERARMIDLSRRSLEGGALLGAQWMVFHLETWDGAYDVDHFSAMRDYNVDLFRELLPVAEECGLGLALENSMDRPSGGNVRTFGGVPSELMEVVDALDSRAVGVCWDTGHGHRARLDQAVAIRALGSRIKALHINDNNSLADQHLLPFFGGIDWPAVVGSLKSVGYSGDFTFEAGSSVQSLPDELQDSMLRYSVDIGNYLMSLE